MQLKGAAMLAGMACVNIPETNQTRQALRGLSQPA